MTLQETQEQAEAVAEYVATVTEWHQLRPRKCKRQDVVCVIERRTGSGTTRRSLSYRPQDMGGRP